MKLMNDNYHAMIEMPANTSLKLEIDERGKLNLDRILDVVTPHAYGFLPDTVAEDADNLDVFIISTHALPTQCRVTIDIRGMIEMEDNGEKDHKIIATIIDETITDADVTSEVKAIKEYLSTYKKGIKLGKFKSKKYALQLIRKCSNMYLGIKATPSMWKEML